MISKLYYTISLLDVVSIMQAIMHGPQKRCCSAALVFTALFASLATFGQNATTVPAGPPAPIVPSVALLEIDVSDPPPKAADGTFTFRVIADNFFPEDGKPTGHPHIEFSPYISVKEVGHTSEAGRTLWSYTAKVEGDDKNLVRLRVSICETTTCTGKLDKTKQRIIDLGSTKFDDYAVVVHPRGLTAGNSETSAYISLERQGHVVIPSSTLKLRASARDGCVQFASKPTAPLDGSIDLVIDAERRRSQTDYFTIVPASMPPENCVIDVAVFDDEKQRPTPAPDQLQMKTNMQTSAAMCFVGTVVAFVFPLWRRIRRSQKPYVTWTDLFEVVAKGFFAVLLALVLTKTDFIGITIDKSSVNGFFTTGFLLGFLPLDTIFDRILRGVGVNPPADNLAQNVEPTSS
jgi:hypothetical protein